MPYLIAPPIPDSDSFVRRVRTRLDALSLAERRLADFVLAFPGELVVDYTHAYSPFFQAIFAPKKTQLKSWADLTGKSISVTRRAMADTELATVMPADNDVKRFEDHVGRVSAFTSGQV